MKKAQVIGFLVIGLKEIKAVSEEEFYQNISEPEPSVQFVSRNLHSNKYFFHKEDFAKSNFLNAKPIRFQRLSKIAHSYFHYSISYTQDSIPNILKSGQSKFDRILIFQSSSLLDHYLELIKIFRANSFLVSRMIRFQEISNLFLHFGHISKNKIERILYKGKASDVSPYTFQVMQLVLDRDLKNRINRVIPRSEKREVM